MAVIRSTSPTPTVSSLGDNSSSASHAVLGVVALVATVAVPMPAAAPFLAGVSVEVLGNVETATGAAQRVARTRPRLRCAAAIVGEAAGALSLGAEWSRRCHERRTRQSGAGSEHFSLASTCTGESTGLVSEFGGGSPSRSCPAPQSPETPQGHATNGTNIGGPGGFYDSGTPG